MTFRYRLCRAVLQLCLLFLPCLLYGCGSATHKQESTLDQIMTTHRIKVGYIIFPPTVTRDLKTGKLGGHHVDTLNEIARLSNLKVDFVETEWATFSAGLAAKRFDISIAPTFVTIPRASTVAFTRPLFFAGNSAIVRREETRFSDLASIDKPGIVVAVTEGEAGSEYAKANFKHAKIVSYPGSDQSLTFQNVLTRRADIALGDAYVTSRFAADHQQQVRDLFAEHPYNLTPVSWAVRRSDEEFLMFINNCLDALEYQGKLKEFEKRAGAHWLHIRRDWIAG